jgi:hypothetical protein
MAVEIQPTDFRAIEEVNKIESAHPARAALHNEEFELTARAVAAIASSEPVEADCHHDFHAAHFSGRRPLSVIDLIVIHVTEGGTAQSVASYFTKQTSGGSTQLVVDDCACFRCLADTEIPWGAPGANYNGFHIEQCGWSRWLKAMWSGTHRKTLMRAAYKTAYHCRKYGISPRFLFAANLKAGMRNGITTHAECSKAFGGDHHDPGTGWPRVLFMAMVKGYYLTLRRVKKVA